MCQEHFAEHDITLEVVSATGWVKNLGLLLGRDCMKGYMWRWYVRSWVG